MVNTCTRLRQLVLGYGEHANEETPTPPTRALSGQLSASFHQRLRASRLVTSVTE